jgi:hypothetical protein
MAGSDISIYRQKGTMLHKALDLAAPDDIIVIDAGGLDRNASARLPGSRSHLRRVASAAGA